jgi:small subunit ribosomal protein S24e
MKLTIKSQKENPLLSRKEIAADIVFTGATPSKDAVKNEIAGQFKVQADVVEIKEVKTEFGYEKGNVLAYVYKDAASKKEMLKQKKPKKAAAKPEEAQ